VSFVIFCENSDSSIRVTAEDSNARDQLLIEPLSPISVSSVALWRNPSVLSVAVRFVPEGDRKPIPRIDTHRGEVQINQFLLGENAGGFRVDFIGQMVLND
jgi:hypothetical protein